MAGGNITVRENQRICVIGIWHLGSVVSACLADLGYLVTGVDADRRRVSDLNNGAPPVFEQGLEELIKNNLNSGRLSYTTDISYALENCNFVLITHDTPVDDDDEVDLSPIFDTTTELAKYLEDDSIIIVSSQVPIGTCDHIKAVINQNNPSLEVDIAYSPENLRLGRAIECFKNPERIVIGADSDSTLDRVEVLFNVIPAPKLRMNLRTAEMTKHALNAFLATTISFANEIANLCDELGVDAISVAAALQSEARIGSGLPLLPGLAFSGGTLARDIKILKKVSESFGYEAPLIKGVWEVNQQQNKQVIKKLKKIYGSVDNLSIGILGLTYKAGTSTLRRSASLEIIKELINKGVIVKAFDPKADPEEIKLHKGFEFCADPYTAARETDALIILTDWPEFKNLDFNLIKSSMKRPVLIDGKNMLDSEQMIRTGFLYSGIGRGQKL
ncbi:UDP-glucose dehydrogenase family protein [Chloroflexota bacterium]